MTVSRAVWSCETQRIEPDLTSEGALYCSRDINRIVRNVSLDTVGSAGLHFFFLIVYCLIAYSGVYRI